MKQNIAGGMDAILRLPQVMRITGLSRSSIYAMEANECFPKRLKLGPRSVGWLESEVASWLLTRAQNRGAAKIPIGPKGELLQ